MQRRVVGRRTVAGASRTTADKARRRIYPSWCIAVGELTRCALVGRTARLGGSSPRESGSFRWVPSTSATSNLISYEHDAVVVDAASGPGAARPLGAPPRRRRAGERHRLDRVRRRRRRRSPASRRRRRRGSLAPARRRASSCPATVLVRVDAERRARVASAAHRLAHPQRPRVRPLPRHARHRRADQRRRHRPDGLRPLADRQRRAARPRCRRQRGHPPAVSTCAACTSTPARPTSTAGLVRSLSVAPPPTPDGQLRVIDIDGVDRQACGGTHLSNTGAVATVPHHQGREQGQAQPPHPLRAHPVKAGAGLFGSSVLTIHGVP